LADLLREAWAVRRANFPDELVVVQPTATRTVSVTGRACALQCAHCGGHYLETMQPLAAAVAVAGTQAASSVKSYLVSGGCDRAGRVPWPGDGEALARLKAQARLNVHAGLVPVEEVAGVGRVSDVVSFDFVGDDATIREVYGLDRTVEDYLTSFRALRWWTRVVPHICVGLAGGRLRGEYRALDLLAAEGCEALAVIVFRPTPGSVYADRTPPPLQEVSEFLARARLALPKTPLHLGCLRPGGLYRRRLDVLAVQTGVNRIVQPAPDARRQAGERGLRLLAADECCAF
jgi:uncharacterized radical SAM superfamily protein